jgi:hypothetical protein
MPNLSQSKLIKESLTQFGRRRILNVYNRVRYVGAPGEFERVSPDDIGYVIEDYGDGNFEVEFSNPDGTTRTQAVIARQNLELAER